MRDYAFDKMDLLTSHEEGPRRGESAIRPGKQGQLVVHCEPNFYSQRFTFSRSFGRNICQQIEITIKLGNLCQTRVCETIRELFKKSGCDYSSIRAENTDQSVLELSPVRRTRSGEAPIFALRTSNLLAHHSMTFTRASP